MPDKKKSAGLKKNVAAALCYAAGWITGLIFLMIEKKDDEIFKWFLASVLFGARISETIAKNTYKTFAKYGLLTSRKILEAGWDFLVNPIMREGGYVRYDGKTSTQILKNCETLLKKYNGSLNKLHEKAKDSKDLENRLLAFHGVGPVTVNIFLRELRPFWEKADPEVLLIVKKLAKEFGIKLDNYNRKSLTFIRVEAGLIPCDWRFDLWRTINGTRVIYQADTTFGVTCPGSLSPEEHVALSVQGRCSGNRGIVGVIEGRKADPQYISHRHERGGRSALTAALPGMTLRTPPGDL